MQEDLEQNGIPELKAGENSSDSPTRALHNKTAKVNLVESSMIYNLVLTL